MKKMDVSIIKEKAQFVWKIPSFPVLFLTNFIFGLSLSFFVPFSSLYGMDEVGMSNIGFGIFMTVMAIGGVVISTFIAKLSDQAVSRKKLLIIASLTAIAGYVGLAYFRNYYALCFTAFFLLGTAAAAVPQLWAYAREALKQADVPNEETPFIMNVFRMFFALAWTVGPALAAWLLLFVGFKGLFLFVAAGYLLALLVIVFFLKDVPNVLTANQKPVILKTFMMKPHIFANLSAAFLLSAAASIHMLNVPQYVTKVIGGTEMDVGIIFSVPPIFEVPMMIAVGLLATKINNGFLIKIGFSLAFLYFFLFFFVREPWQIYPLQVLSAAQVSITAGLAISYFQDFMPEATGSATTLYMNSTQIGSTAGYLLFGVFSEWLGYGNLIVIYTLFAAIAVLFLVFFGKVKESSSVFNEVSGRKI